MDKETMARARQGDAEAQYAVGQSLLALKGKPEVEAVAVEWLRKAAEQGHVEARYCVGVAYAKGIGVAQNELAALNWFRSLAGDGYSGVERALQFMGDSDGDMEWVLEATNARRKGAGMEELSSTFEIESLTAAEAMELVREGPYNLYLDGLDELAPGVAEPKSPHLRWRYV